MLVSTRRAAPEATLMTFDTALGSENLGDQIIMDSVHAVRSEIFGSEVRSRRVGTHHPMGWIDIAQAFRADVKVVGGTNLLNGDFRRFRQWRFGPSALPALRGTVLLGCGWWQYEERVTAEARRTWQWILGSTWTHAVRDTYTRDKLASIGIANVAYTGCPTMWDLTPEHCAKLPTAKAESVVFTLTDYSREPRHDRSLVELLKGRYGRVFFWPQGRGDAAYLRDLAIEGVEVLPNSLEAYNSCLSGAEPLDYVGTRLHGGIRALQFSRRSAIVAIDNRATEIGRDTGLRVFQRGDLDSLSSWIAESDPLQLMMPWGAISAWRDQFQRSPA